MTELPSRENISPDLERRMRAAVFEALNNAAEGGYDHADDGMSDLELCDSLFDYDETCSDLVEEAAAEEGEGVGFTPILAVHVQAWRTLRRAGHSLPVPAEDGLGEVSMSGLREHMLGAGGEVLDVTALPSTGQWDSELLTLNSRSIKMSVTMCHTPDGGHAQVVHSYSSSVSDELPADQLGEVLVAALQEFWLKMESQGYRDRNLSRLTTVVSLGGQLTWQTRL